MTELRMSESDPVKVMEKIEKDLRALDTASAELGAATSLYYHCEMRWKTLNEAENLRIWEKAKGDGVASPPEAIRNAMAARAVTEQEPKLYKELVEAKARMESLRPFLAAKRATLDGRRSLLTTLRAEA